VIDGWPGVTADAVDPAGSHLAESGTDRENPRTQPGVIDGWPGVIVDPVDPAGSPLAESGTDRGTLPASSLSKRDRRGAAMIAGA
jgi:hypothetical protein